MGAADSAARDDDCVSRKAAFLGIYVAARSRHLHELQVADMVGSFVVRTR
jgi:hypothetical protein